MENGETEGDAENIQKYIISWRMENEEEGAEKIQKYMSTLGHRRGWSMRMSRQTNPIICEQKPKTCLQKDVGEDIWGVEHYYRFLHPKLGPNSTLSFTSTSALIVNICFRTFPCLSWLQGISVWPLMLTGDQKTMKVWIWTMWTSKRDVRGNVSVS